MSAYSFLIRSGDDSAGVIIAGGLLYCSQSVSPSQKLPRHPGLRPGRSDHIGIRQWLYTPPDTPPVTLF